MKSKLLFGGVGFVFLFLMITTFATAFEFDNIKSETLTTFDGKQVEGNTLLEKYKPIEIKNAFGLGATLFEGYLSQHDTSCGQECSSTMEIKLTNEGVLVNAVDFYTILEDESRVKQNIRDYQFYLKTDQEAYSVDDYEYQCVDTGKINVNGTKEQSCSNIKVGSHTEYEPLWKKYNIGDSVPAGTYTLKLEADKKPSRTVDWVIKTTGETLSEWAEWGSSTLANGQVAYYKFDNNNFFDATSNSYDTTNYGTTNESGIIIDGRNFDGSGAWIDTTETSAFNFLTASNFSFSFWIRVDELANGDRLFSNVNGGDGYQCILATNNKTQCWGEAGGVVISNDALTVDGTTWNHVVWTHEEGTTILYINGDVSTPTSGAVAIDSSSVDLEIGRSAGGGGTTFDGTMDEFGVWNRTLTTTEITELYASGTPASAQQYPYTQGTVTLNSPADTSTTYVLNNLFNASVNVTGGSTLVNMSLWTNESGTFELKNSTLNPSGTISTEQWMTTSNNTFSTSTSHFWTNMTAVNNGIVKVVSVVSSDGSDTGNVNVKIFQNGVELASVTDSFPNTQIVNITFSQSDYSDYIYKDVDSGNFQIQTIKGTCANLRYFNSRSYTGTYFTASNQKKAWGHPAAGDNYISFEANDTGTSSTQTWNRTITDSIIWNVQACDTDGDCGFATSNYSLSIDTTAPIIEILSPTGTQTYGYNGQNSSLNYSITDTNLDSCWFNYNGTNVTTPCATNYSIILESENYNLTMYANDSVGNLATNEHSWNYMLFEHGQTYNANTVETSTESFIADITYNQSMFNLLTGNLWYNGTANSGTKGSTDARLNISTLVAVPNLDTQTNYTFYWNIGLVSASGTTYVNLTSHNQSVDILNMSLCGNPHTVPYINFTVYDEETGNALNASFKSTLTYSTTTSTSQSSFSYSDTTETKNEFDFCMDPSTYDYKLDTNIELSAANYVTRFFTWQQLTITNGTVEKNLYLLNESGSTSFIVQVIDAGNNKQTGVQVEIERFSVGLGTWILEEVLTTNFEGKTIAHLASEDADYKFKVYESGTSIYNSSSTKISCEVLPCTVRLVVPGDISTGLESLEDLTTSLTYNEDTNIFTFTYEDESATFSSGELNVYKFNAGNSSDNALACTTSSSSSSAVLACDISAEVNGTYKAIGSITRTDEGESDVKILYGVVGDTIYNRVGIEGVLWSFFLFIGIVMAGVMRPSLAIIAAVSGIIILTAINIISIGMTAIVAIVALAIVLLIQVKKE